jgi:glycosyltransferase involved in cell wall biosynthesis
MRSDPLHSARRASSPGKALVSVITCCHNQLDYTRLCVSSLLRQTPPPFELVIVDDGSTDDTPVWLSAFARNAGARVRVITNDSALGRPAARNRGLDVAQGEYIILIDNDTILAHGWLGGLIAAANSDSAVGLVGPMSNNAQPPQVVTRVTYRSLRAMGRFAADWRRRQARRRAPTDWLGGFCILMKRRAFEAVGHFDEQFVVLDDDDFSIRVDRAGYRMLVARDVFVHHFGGRTLLGRGLDPEALFQECHQRLASKWGEAAGSRARRASPPWIGPLPADPTRLRGFRIDMQRFACAWENWRPTEPNGRPALLNPQPRRRRVSLTMIVRDEEANLPSCLESAAGLFDEVIVVDTGSADRTAEIATFYGARVGHFAWCDDFAAARNAALDLASGEYVFWLDADDRVEPAERPRIRQLLDGLDDLESAYIFHCVCPGNDPKDELVLGHLRLFPRRPGVCWTYRIHEQVVPTLEKAGIRLAWTDLRIRHEGYSGGPSSLKRKSERELRLLLAEQETRPDDPFVMLNLARCALAQGYNRDALDHLRRCVAHPDASHFGSKPYVLLAEAHSGLGELDAALAACTAGCEAFPNDPELLCSEAGIRVQLGDRDGAEACWLKVLASEPPKTFLMLDKGIFSHVSLRNLANLRQERGDLIGALTLWRRVLAECPGDPQATAVCLRIARQIVEEFLADPRRAIGRWWSSFEATGLRPSWRRAVDRRSRGHS